MRYYEVEDTPWMSFSRTGQREDEESHAFLGMGDRHRERMYAMSMLLYLWARHPEAKAYLDGQEFHPTDEEFAEAQEPSKPQPEIRSDDSVMPESLVAASVEIDKLLHEEDEPRRRSLAQTMERARAKKRKKVKPAKKGGRLHAMLRAGQT